MFAEKLIECVACQDKTKSLCQSLLLKIFSTFSLIVFFTASEMTFAEEIVEIPGIEVVGNRGARCRAGISCLMVGRIDSLIDDTPPYESPTYPGDHQNEENNFRAEFCDKLMDERPFNCGVIIFGDRLVLNNIPSVPIFDPNWSGNGCGTGGGANFFLDFVIPGFYDDFYELDEPYQGVSFLSPCNAHDQCFGAGGSVFSNCNSEFLRDMNNACNGIARCRAFASAYHAAVESSFGQTAFDNAQSDWDCASWVDTYKINHCDYESE